MSGNIIEVNDTNFSDEVEKSDTPVLIDFSAEWCGPCRMFHPTLEAVASEYADRIKVGKIDVDQSPQTAGKFGIRGVPTVMIFRNGKVEASFVGLQPKDVITSALDEALA